MNTLVEDLVAHWLAVMYFLLAYLSFVMDLSRVLMLIATLSLQEKPRVSLKKFVKIGRPGCKGRKPTGSRQIRSVHKLLTGFVRTACFKLLKQVW